MKVERLRIPRNETNGLKGILANISLFQDLDTHQLDELVAGTQPIRVPANTCVVAQGELARGIFNVVYGQVKIGFERKDGGEKTLAILGPDKCFGLGEMMLECEYLTFVKTTADTMLVHTARATALGLARDNFAFAQALMTCAGRQLYALTSDIGTYSLLNARQRLAGYLLREREHQQNDCIELSASKSLVASLLSLTPETLSRLLHEFSSDGMVAVTGRRIRILDSDKMNALLAA